MSLFKTKSIEPKIFCISFQKNGTTSVGTFFKDHGYKVQFTRNKIVWPWTISYMSGDYESIFRSKNFKKNQVFQDNPWFYGDFYKFLFHRFPDAKFVLLTRDADSWFDSMMAHSDGKTLGNTYFHTKIYDRRPEYRALHIKKNPYDDPEKDSLLPLTEEYREHYKTIFNERIQEIREFFEYFGSDRIIISELENPQKWQIIGDYFGIEVAPGYEAHANKT